MALRPGNALGTFFLYEFFAQVSQEPEWQNTTDCDLQEIQHAVHRTLLSRQSIYHMVLYPNREVDIQRDQVFGDHIATIAQRITPQHPKLQIPAKYCRECPWPSAQEEAKLIAVYRTPQEKMTQTARLCKVTNHAHRNINFNYNFRQF